MPGARVLDVASMGPSMSIDGVPPYGPRSGREVPVASMGPSMSIDGVTPLPRRPPRTRSRFNGAVDEHRRSRAQHAGLARVERGASMGPSMSIDGVTSPVVSSASTPKTLQWGRR